MADLAILPSGAWACDDCRADFQANAATWREVTPAFYEHMRGCVPPIELGQGLPGFMVGEPFDHTPDGAIHLVLVYHPLSRKRFARYLPRRSVRLPIQDLYGLLRSVSEAS